MKKIIALTVFTVLLGISTAPSRAQAADEYNFPKVQLASGVDEHALGLDGKTTVLDSSGFRLTTLLEKFRTEHSLDNLQMNSFTLQPETYPYSSVKEYHGEYQYVDADGKVLVGNVSMIYDAVNGRVSVISLPLAQNSPYAKSESKLVFVDRYSIYPDYYGSEPAIYRDVDWAEYHASPVVECRPIKPTKVGGSNHTYCSSNGKTVAKGSSVTYYKDGKVTNYSKTKTVTGQKTNYSKPQVAPYTAKTVKTKPVVTSHCDTVSSDTAQPAR